VVCGRQSKPIKYLYLRTGKTSENGQLSYKYGKDRRLFLIVKLENDRDRLGHWSVVFFLLRRWLNVQSNQSKRKRTLL
jgi:hypothetical protein